MYTVVGTFYALPGRAPELLALMHELKTLGKKLNGAEATVATPVAGKIAEVHYIYQASSLDEHEKRLAEVAQNDEFKKIGAKIAAIVVPNTAQWQIYRHV